MTARPSGGARIGHEFGNASGAPARAPMRRHFHTTGLTGKPSGLALAGLALAVVTIAGFGLRFSLAEIGPKAPPLADLEAALAWPQLVPATAPAAADAVPEQPPSGSDLALSPAGAAVQTRLLEGLDEAGSAALAAEATPAAINRLVEVKRGDTLMNLLVEAGIGRGEAHAAITALAEVFSPRRLRPGQSIRLVLAAGAPPTTGEQRAGQTAPLRLVSLGLSSSPEEEVHVVRQAEDAGYLARAEARPLEYRLSAHSGTIESSLFVAARDAGMAPDAVVELIRLFSFDVDFQREIQPGDRFEVLYDSYYDRAGALAKTGPLLYASMVLSGKRLEFYHFVTDDGLEDHFDAKGRSVRRALLRTPIDGARISSGYGRRKHPIQGYTKMHRGVDFAAPRGTPIYAAGRGVIDRIGRWGAYGKYIRIRHNSTYRTAYAHLHRYAKGMRKGARVKQGQVIGYVGSTGRSTGSHLHYEVLVNNKQVNPRKIKLPSGKKLKGADLEAFQRVRAEIDRLRDDALGEALIAETSCAGEWPGTVAAGQSGEPPPSEAAGC